MDKIQNNTAVFLIPHWTNDISKTRYQLDEAVDSIRLQTDNDWLIVIVDDNSPCVDAGKYLQMLDQENDNIHVIFRSLNEGPGASRNTGIAYANEICSPFILYNDADDTSHPDRLKCVRSVFGNELDVDVVYSTFNMIDENGNKVPCSELTGSIAEILEGHRKAPLEGADIWIDIGIDRGYTNLTSATAVRTTLANAYPFPKENVSEDSYTWMMYSAGGNKYKYVAEIPTCYRVPQTGGSYSRIRVDHYYQTKAIVDERGFVDSLRIAGEKNSYYKNEAIRDELMVRFYVKLGETLFRESEEGLAQEQVDKAINISSLLTDKYLKKMTSNFKDLVSEKYC